jgi:hypothetical protein
VSGTPDELSTVVLACIETIAPDEALLWAGAETMIGAWVRPDESVPPALAT